MRRIGKGQVVGDLVNWLIGEDELTLGLRHHSLTDQMTGGDPDGAFDVIVEPIGRHRQLLGIETELTLASKVRFNEATQRLDGVVGNRQRHQTGARLAGGEPGNLNGNQGKQGAQSKTIAVARQESFVIKISAQRQQSRALFGAMERDDRIGRQCLEPAESRPGAFAQCLSDILAKADNPSGSHLRQEAKSVGHGRGYQNGRRRGERTNRRLMHHLAAPALDRKDLEKIAMAVRLNRPVVQRGARRNGLDVDEIESLVVRRIAVKMKEREGRSRTHRRSIGERGGDEHAGRPPPSNGPRALPQAWPAPARADAVSPPTDAETLPSRPWLPIRGLAVMDRDACSRRHIGRRHELARQRAIVALTWLPRDSALGMEYFLQQLINGLTLGSIYGLIAIGYTMVYGIIGMINFAHGDIFMVGSFLALITFLLAVAAGVTAVPLALLVVIVVAMTLTALYGWTVERIAYRPLRHSFRLAPLISAIGMSIVLQNYVQIAQGARVKPLPPLIRGGYTLLENHGFAVELSNVQIIIVVTTLAVMVIFAWLVAKTRLGRDMRACEQDLKMAALLGVDTDRTISLTFLIGAALAAVAGIMYLIYYGVVDFFIGFVAGVKAFTAAVLGGIGSLPGAMLGGLLIGLIETFWSAYFSVEYKDVAAFSVLIIVLIFLPTGILGRPEVEKV